VTIAHPGAVSVLRTGTTATTGPDGRPRATVQLHGELCATTARLLRAELERLVEDGAVELTIDLTELTLCTSHGLDVFDDIHRLLHGHRRGQLRLRGARGVVRDVLDVVRDADRSFSPTIVDG
jgi:anti-anti-sigma regulatory factor